MIKNRQDKLQNDALAQIYIFYNADDFGVSFVR